jgi:uncharacterized RDD family membrane protein YckC
MPCPDCFTGVTPAWDASGLSRLGGRGSTARLAAADNVDCMTDQHAASTGEFYPGQSFGLPEAGPGSVAGWSRRLAALVIDWIAASLITIAFLYHPAAGHAADVLSAPRGWTPLVFGLQDFLLTATTGFTLGKRLTGLRVIRLTARPRPVGFPRALARTLLLMLVVPAMMMDRDLRGLQDKAAGTVVVRM